jgi:hypothetical protein
MPFTVHSPPAGVALRLNEEVFIQAFCEDVIVMAGEGLTVMLYRESAVQPFELVYVYVMANTPGVLGVNTPLRLFPFKVYTPPFGIPSVNNNGNVPLQ